MYWAFCVLICVKKSPFWKLALFLLSSRGTEPALLGQLDGTDLYPAPNGLTRDSVLLCDDGCGASSQTTVFL
jgi:hypothetical protein